MRKFCAAFLSIVFVCGLCGCVEDQYAVERRYWQVKRQAEPILKNPAATPQNELRRVVGLLDGFINAYPKNVLALQADFLIASLYLSRQEYDQARSHLKKIMEKYKPVFEVCAEAQFLIASSYQQQEKWDAALAEYRKVSSEYPTTSKGLEMPLFLVLQYRKMNQPDKMLAAADEAVGTYRGLIAQYPMTAVAFKAYTYISSVHSSLKRWQQAVQNMNEMYETFKGRDKLDLSGLLSNMAVIYRKELKDDARARQALELAVREYPNGKFTKAAEQMLGAMDK